ncbi:hypothetical protein D3C86_1766120 [compost metagenome]
MQKSGEQLILYWSVLPVDVLTVIISSIAFMRFKFMVQNIISQIECVLIYFFALKFLRLICIKIKMFYTSTIAVVFQ